MNPAAIPPPAPSGAWLARYSDLQSSLYAALAGQLGLAGAGGRDAFGDLFQIAVMAAWIKERDGEPLRNPDGFLRQVIVNQRKMQLRSARRHPTASFDTIAEMAERLTSEKGFGRRAAELITDHRASVSEQVERHEVAELIRHIVLTIERRAGMVWALRWLYGYTPEEVMAELRITPRQYKRLCERARAAIGRKLVAYLAGDWCPGYGAKFSRLAAGLATPAQAEQAQTHLAACPACRHAYETFTRIRPDV